MTTSGAIRAARALFSAKTFGDKYFPKAFVVGNSVFFTYNAARRASEESNYAIEEITIQQAHDFVSDGKKLPREIENNIDEKCNQIGELYAGGHLYNPFYTIK